MTYLRQIHGHLDERRAEARAHLAEHLETLAERLRRSDLEPLGVAAVVLLEDGSRDFEMCCGDGVEALALAASLDGLGRTLADEE